jgi:DNA modification methylase
VNGHDVKHRDCYESLAAMRDAGGVDLILTSPPYPDARKVEAYGAEFDTSMAGYQKLGDAVFEALKPGGVCALNIDGPVRIWRPELGESERSLIAFKVAIDWAERAGFRYVEHCAYMRNGVPGLFGPRWRSGWEPVHVFARPGAPVHFDPGAFTLASQMPGKKQQNVGGRTKSNKRSSEQVNRGARRTSDRKHATTATAAPASRGLTDPDHSAPFSRILADAYVLCYAPPGGTVGDPFVGSGTVAFACHRHGRSFIGGDLGTRERDGRRWADIVTDGIRQTTLFGGLDE